MHSQTLALQPAPRSVRRNPYLKEVQIFRVAGVATGADGHRGERFVTQKRRMLFAASPLLRFLDIVVMIRSCHGSSRNWRTQKLRTCLFCVHMISCIPKLVYKMQIVVEIRYVHIK